MAPTGASSYEERLLVPAGWWLAGAVLTLSLWWTFVLATPGWFALSAAVVAGAAISAGLWQYGRATVEVTNLHLRAGAARVPLSCCGEVEALDAEQTRALHGPQADARAFFLIRPYIATSVRVEITDPQDPTPYWLVGSRHAEDLASALAARLSR
ncbi:MAG: DUF3093 domain-containing protein [Nocardioidaceae bacterium]|jgi:hypothetical protein|nr:DUF3093 domain-containing protein [Nocardioidaceae bacterium]